MRPTNKLRFVSRSVVHNVQQDGTAIHTFKNILQQWWEENDGRFTFGEWRDVPVETEE